MLAVLTAEDLKPLKLHWMPTLAGDVQAVVADEKVCFQNQEGAMVIATHRYIAADGGDLVEVEDEPLPALVELAEKYGCIMMIDDAHSSGVLGKNGRGTVNHFGLDGRGFGLLLAG